MGGYFLKFQWRNYIFLWLKLMPKLSRKFVNTRSKNADIFWFQHRIFLKLHQHTVRIWNLRFLDPNCWASAYFFNIFLHSCINSHFFPWFSKFFLVLPWFALTFALKLKKINWKHLFQNSFHNFFKPLIIGAEFAMSIFLFFLGSFVPL